MSILQFIPLIFSPRLPTSSVENSQLLDYVRYRCLTQNQVVASRLNTVLFVWLAAATTKALGKEEMHIEPKRLQGVPLNVIFVAPAAPRVEVISHYELKTAIVI